MSDKHPAVDFNIHNIVQIVCASKTDENSVGYGTAFFVGKGVLVTARHVLQKYFDNPNEYKVSIKYHDGKDYEMKSVLSTENKYITIIELNKKCNDEIPLSFTDGYDARIGMDCIIYGYPKYAGGDWRQIPGKVNNIGSDAENTASLSNIWINSTQTIGDFQGLSGSPILAGKYVIGIVQEEIYSSHVMDIGGSLFSILKTYVASDYYKEYSILSRIEDWKREGLHIQTIDEVENYLHNAFSLKKNLQLSFFASDDEQFNKNFFNQIEVDASNIYVSGISKEETLYTILHALSDYKKPTIVVCDFESWSKLQGKLTGCILIAYFDNADEIQSISQNINIFLFSNQQIHGQVDVLYLPRKTKATLVKRYFELGLEDNFFEKTHGYFIPFKRTYFNGKYNQEPVWTNCKEIAFPVALLCGQWTESEKDKSAIEKLCGFSFGEFKKILSPFMYGEEPFAISYRLMNEMDRYRIVNLELVWDVFGNQITNELWNRFVEMFMEIISTVPSQYHQIFDCDFPILENRSDDYSKELREGTVQTLFFAADYLGKQKEIDKIVESVLSKITSIEHLAYISKHLLSLCEASPNSVLRYLSKPLTDDNLVLRLFQKDVKRDILFTSSFYTYILWTMELLLGEKEPCLSCVRWLLEMQQKNISYKMENQPKTVLIEVFSAWYNVVPLSADEKQKLAEKLLGSYDNLWDILYEELPTSNLGRVMQPLVRFHYRMPDHVPVYTSRDMNRLHLKYTELCIENIHGKYERIEKMMDALHIMPEDIATKIENALVDFLQTADDTDKYAMMCDLRNLIYRHRYFAGPNWNMDEERLVILEKILNDIQFQNPYYRNMYWLTASHNYPILHPYPFQHEENIAQRDKNDTLREKELDDEIGAIRASGYDIVQLLVFGFQNEDVWKKYSFAWLGNIGENFARYYARGQFNQSLYERILTSQDLKTFCLHPFLLGYISHSISWENLQENLRNIRECTISYDPKLYAKLLSYEELTEQALIFSESNEEVQREFWSTWRPYAIKSESANIPTQIVNRLIDAGNLSRCIEFVANELHILSTKQILCYLNKIIEAMKQTSLDTNNLPVYWLEEIIDFLEKSAVEENRQELSIIEFFLSPILEWNHLKTLQEKFQSEPEWYASVVDKVFKHDSEAEEKITNFHSWYECSKKIRFCPGLREGIVQKEALGAWLKQFRSLLQKQNQEFLYSHLLGKLFSDSPVGKDGAYPAEPIRDFIEQMYYEDFLELKKSYVNSEFNKRGVYYYNAGENTYELALSYQKNMEDLELFYPQTAQIFGELYLIYKEQAIAERRSAEHGIG